LTGKREERRSRAHFPRGRRSRIKSRETKITVAEKLGSRKKETASESALERKREKEGRSAVADE